MNEDILEQLQLIERYYKLKNDEYRGKAYSSAINAIKGYNNKIASGNDAKKYIKGIGPSIAKDIDEYLTTGKITRLENLRSELNLTDDNSNEVIEYYSSFFGINSKTAKKFYELGYRTLADIWYNVSLTEAQKLGIIWRDHINQRIPYSEMNTINNYFENILNPYNIEWKISGSYRRQESSSGDIDLLVLETDVLDMNSLIYILQDVLVAKLTQGDVKFLGMFRLNKSSIAHRIDILIIPKEEWYYALMYFTGSQKFNILMRQRALELGYSLNEHGMKNIETNEVYKNAKSEKDIFNFLNLKYVKPEDRLRTLEQLEILEE